MYSPSSVLSFSILRTSDVFMVEFQAMLAMKIISVSMRYGSPRHAFVIDVVHQAVHRERVLPREPLVDAHGLAGLVDEQVVGRRRPAHWQAAERLVRLHGSRRVRRFRARRNRARKRRLVPKAAGPVDRAEDRHQDRQRADRLEPVAVRGQPAHRVERNRIAGDGVVLLAPGVGPGNRQLDLLVARGDAHLMRQAADGRGRDAGDAFGPIGRVLAHAFGQQFERGLDLQTVVEREAAQQQRIGAFGVGRPPACPSGDPTRACSAGTSH